jgi:hypothetical protein
MWFDVGAKLLSSLGAQLHPMSLLAQLGTPLQRGSCDNAQSKTAKNDRLLAAAVEPLNQTVAHTPSSW